MIRKATLEDVSELVQCVKQYHASSPLFKGLTFCPEATARLAVQCIMQENSSVLIYKSEGIIKGYVSTTFTNWFSKELIAIEDMFYICDVEGRGRIALRLARYWLQYCLDNDAKKVYTSSTAGFGSNGYNKLMQKIGFNKFEGDFLIHG